MMNLLKKTAASRVADAVVVFVAALVAVLLFGLLVARLMTSDRPVGSAESVVVENDGVPRIYVHLGNSPYAHEMKVQILGLDRKPVAVVRLADSWKRYMPHTTLRPRTSGLGKTGYRSESRYLLDRLARSHLPHLFAMEAEGYLVGYDPVSRMPDYHVSPSGFSGSRPDPDDRFGNISGCSLAVNVFLLVSGRNVWEADADNRRIDRIYTGGSGKLQLSYIMVPADEERRTSNDHLIVLDGNELVRIGPDRKISTRITLPPDLLKELVLWVGSGKDGILVVWTCGWYGDGTGRAVVFNKAGAKIAEHEWPAPPLPRGPPTWPLVAVMVMWPLLAGLCLWHARRHALALWKTITWAVFVLLTGPMGAAVYFGAQDFAPLVDCPSCKGGRPAVCIRKFWVRPYRAGHA